MHIHQQDLDRAIHAAAAMVDSLRATLHDASPVEALAIMPMIADAARLWQQIKTLEGAIRDSQ